MWNRRNRVDKQQNDEAGTAEVQALLRDLHGARPEPSPFFAVRVMAAIEAREAELGRKARAWAAVPSFASRLSAVAALLLVMASTWLWVAPRVRNAATPGLVEDVASYNNSANQDDVFVTSAGEAQ